jgi:hypothetical protein
MESNKRFIGIDPGKTGHVVELDNSGKIVDHYVTPVIGKEYDKQQMSTNLFKFSPYNIDRIRAHVLLENVHATQMGGKASNFDFGRGKGLWEMALMALEISHTMVTPKEWQKLMWQGAKTQYMATKRKTKQGTFVKKVDTKATSLLAAKMLQPQQEWRVIGKKGSPTTKIDDGFVDAYLMAEYCRRNFY